jgi:hypothetical protein
MMARVHNQRSVICISDCGQPMAPTRNPHRGESEHVIRVGSLTTGPVGPTNVTVTPVIETRRCTTGQSKNF